MHASDDFSPPDTSLLMALFNIRLAMPLEYLLRTKCPTTSNCGLKTCSWFYASTRGDPHAITAATHTEQAAFILQDQVFRWIYETKKGARLMERCETTIDCSLVFCIDSIFISRILPGICSSSYIFSLIYGLIYWIRSHRF